MTVQGPDGKRIQFPDGTPPATIREVMAKRYGGPQGGGWTNAGAELTQRSPYPKWLSSAQDVGTSMIPAAGGLMGGLAGGAAGGLFFGAPGIPAAIEGAAVGGAIGEKVRRTITREPQSVLSTGGAAAEQAALQGGGALLGMGARAVAKPIMRAALGVGKTLPGEVDAAGTALGEGLSANAKPIERATTATMQSSAQLEEVLRRSGRSFPTGDVTSEVRKLLNDRAIPNDQKSRIAAELRMFIRQHGGKIGAPLLKDIKQFFQNEAERAYETASGPLSPHTRFAEAIAKGAQIQLEKIAGVAKIEAQTQGLSAAERALTKAYKRPGRTFEINKPGSWPVPLMTSPGFRSSLAVKLADPRIQAALRQTPRAIVTILHEAAGIKEPQP